MRRILGFLAIIASLGLTAQEKVRDDNRDRVARAEAELARAQETLRQAKAESKNNEEEGRGGAAAGSKDAQAAKAGSKKWSPPPALTPKRYSFGDLEWETIQEVIQPLMSPEGRAVPTPKHRFFILMDTQEAQDKVANCLEALKGNAYNIQIDVEYQNLRSFEAAGIEVRTGPVKIERGGVKTGRIDLDIEGRREKESQLTVASITTISGSGAQLWVSKTVVDHSFLDQYQLCPMIIAPVGRGQDVIVVAERPKPVLREVGVSLYAKPTYLENGIVEVEIYPVVTSVDEKGGRQSFRVEKVETRLRVADGARLYVGGVNKEIDKFLASALGPTALKKSGGSELLSIYLTPHVRPVRPPPGYQEKTLRKQP